MSERVHKYLLFRLIKYCTVCTSLFCLLSPSPLSSLSLISHLSSYFLSSLDPLCLFAVPSSLLTMETQTTAPSLALLLYPYF